MNQPLHSTRFICMDAEFTGLNPEEDRIIEIAAVLFSFDEGVIKSFDELIDPERTIPEESINIHNITPDMVKGKPTINLILPKLLDFLGNHIIIGHQISYDITMIANAAKRASIANNLVKQNSIDTLRLARSYGDSPNNSLIQLAKHFNVPFEDAHRAMNDVLMNIAIFKHLTTKYKTLEEVLTLLTRPIKMKYMPLGKYKGRLFSDIPQNYLNWAVNMDFDQDLLYTIRAELRKRKISPGFSASTNPFSEL